jgi:sugar phosphate isomerase/epimerase
LELAVSSWAFHQPLYTGQMRLWDIPGAVQSLGFEWVELQDLFLWPYGNRLFRAIRRFTNPPSPAPSDRFYDPPLLRRVAEALFQADAIKLAAWDSDPELGRPGEYRRAQAYIRLALQTARNLDAQFLRITVDHGAVGDNVGPVVVTLKPLMADAKRLGVRLALENHGRAANAAHLIDIVNGVDSPWLGVCLDFGNFATGQANTDFERLAPHAIHAHAKSYTFDSNGEETTIPYAHRIETLKAAGYDGVISIEYEGDGDPVQGIKDTRALIERYW